MLAQGWITEGVASSAAKETWRQVGRTHHKAGRFDQAVKAYNKGENSFKTMILKWLASMHYGL
jgi:hypothetical protein